LGFAFAGVSCVLEDFAAVLELGVVAQAVRPRPKQAITAAVKTVLVFMGFSLFIIIAPQAN
jgi:hypothetical protein